MSFHVDLRSDTVTQPTPAMRDAMRDARVGDDCYGEDPSINKLCELAARLLGTEAALFVLGATMANQIALRLLTRPGEEVVCDEHCHIVEHEAGAAAALSQVQLATLAGTRGVLDADRVRERMRAGDDPFQPRTAAVAVENTHNFAGGTVWPLDALRAVSGLGLPVLLDGARLFNASAASGVAPSDYAACATLTTISLYKGLCAPMGALICGSAGMLERAVAVRRMFGGAMRQGGVVAAAGIVALTQMTGRLHEDHELARRLAAGLDLEPPETNIVLLRVPDARAMIASLTAQGIGAGRVSDRLVRFVTHRDVDARGIDRAIRAVRAAL